MRKIEREPNGAGIFKPGQDLVVAGTVGKNGVKAALSAKEKEISARFPEWFVKRIREQADKKSELTPEMLNACGAGEWEEISEGGILAALWAISGAYEQGISFELRKIPVAQETIEICELLDVSPYLMRSGAYLYLTEKDEYGENQEYEKFSEESEDSEDRSAWQKAVKIGTTNGSKDRVILGLEGRRYLNRPGMDEVERLRRELPPR